MVVCVVVNYETSLRRLVSSSVRDVYDAVKLEKLGVAEMKLK